MTIRPDDEELTVKTGGMTLGGWQEVHVVRGVQRLPSAFYIQLTERYPGQATPTVVTPGSTAQVFLGADLILTGYIDQYLPGINRAAHSVLIKGRSKPEDIVDSSLLAKDTGSGSFLAKTMRQAAEKIAKIYHIEVSAPDGDFPIPPPNDFPINTGMTAAQLLDELARTTGTLVWDDPQGRLVISGVGTRRAGSALVEGVNIEMASAIQGMDQRYSDYWVLGQGYDLGTGYNSEMGHAQDPGVVALGRYRTKIIPWEAPDQDGLYSAKRAQWEANRRIGRGERYHRHRHRLARRDRYSLDAEFDRPCDKPVLQGRR